MADETSPVLPATPWWQSEVQLRAVIAMGFQILSIIARYVDLPWLQENMDKIIADVSQLVAIVFATLAIIKRQNSPVQPLSMTSKGAETKTADNPPVLAVDPTKKV